MNMVNPRREFFRDVELEEIENFVKSKGLSAQFIREIEAREYRETLAKLELSKPVTPMPAHEFAPALFQTVTATN
jgi:hypothetical protein